MTTPELTMTEFFDALQAKGCKPKMSGGKGTAHCPCHTDTNASLSFERGKTQEVVAKCFGCKASFAEILAALGIERSNGRAVASRPTTRPTIPPSPPPKSAPARKSRSFAAAAEAFAVCRDDNGRLGPPTFIWEYLSSQGDAVRATARWNLPDGEKTYRYAHRNGDGWIPKSPSKPWILYNMPSLIDGDDPIIVCEGEKASDYAASLGFTATTSGGKDTAPSADWSPLSGHRVVIMPDHDAPGEVYAGDVLHMLAELDTPPVEVKILRLPGLDEKQDIVDFGQARANMTAGEIHAEIMQLIDQAKPESLPGPAGPVVLTLADVQPQSVTWLWPGRIPAGRITLLVGRPGDGKSFTITDAAARITTGTPWPDGTACPVGDVVLISAEDDPADTIRPRVDAHHGNPARVHLLRAVTRYDPNSKAPVETCFTLADVHALELTLQRFPATKLVVVDPIGSYLGGGTDAHRDNEVRSVLAPVALLAERYGVAVVIVAHRRKSSGSFADDLALGSRGFTGITRSVLHLTRDPKDKARRLLLPGKCNLSAPPDGLAFSISGDPARIWWERDPVKLDADEALAAENAANHPGPDPETRTAAVDWLREALAVGPRLAKELYEEAREGEGISRRTLERARGELGVEAYRVEIPGPWWWRLPGQDRQPKTATSPKGDNVAALAVLAGGVENADSGGVSGATPPRPPSYNTLGEPGGLGPDDPAGKPHVAHNSGNNEWYTPPEIVEAARRVMGGIDLDPASSSLANQTVKATTYFTSETNGLAQPWPTGRIWLNPPYAAPLIGQFAERLVDAVRGDSTAIVLVNNATETRWFQALWAVCAAVCFPRSRIRFVDPAGERVSAPLQGQAVMYFGPDIEAFTREFSPLGAITRPAPTSPWAGMVELDGDGLTAVERAERYRAERGNAT